MSDFFGNGSDGDVILDGTTSFPWATLSSSVYTMTRDLFAESVVIDATVTLEPNGWRIFSQGDVTNNGTISAAGNGGSLSPIRGADGTGQGSVGGGYGGGVSSSGNGADAQGVATGQPPLLGTGGNGGNGDLGGGTVSTGGLGGTSVTNTTAIDWFLSPYALLTGGCYVGLGFGTDGGVFSTPSTPGGGSGAGDSTHRGGGGGSGAGNVVIYARNVVNNGTVTVAGGDGFSPSTGNVGGGGGGAGGYVFAYTEIPWTAGTIDVSGGAAGVASGLGSDGIAGMDGNVLNVVIG